jgi:hypothetical protein
MPPTTTLSLLELSTLALFRSGVCGGGESSVKSSELGLGSGALRAFANAARSLSDRKSWSKSGKREAS